MPFGGASGQSALIGGPNSFQSQSPNQLGQIRPSAPLDSHGYGRDSPECSFNQEPQDRIPVSPLDAARKEQQKDQKRFEKFLSQRFDVDIEEYKALEQQHKEEIVAAYEESKVESRQQYPNGQSLIQSQFEQLRRDNISSGSESQQSDSAPEEEDNKYDS